MNQWYADYLTSNHWLDFRDWIMSERGSCCEACGAVRDIQIHHLTYSNLGREQAADVQILCRTCHADAHDSEDEISNVENARAMNASLSRMLQGRRTVPDGLTRQSTEADLPEWCRV